MLDTDPQPEWHDTLHQPEPATAEEHDLAAVRQQDLIGSIFPGGSSRSGSGKPPTIPPRRPGRRKPDDPDWLPDLGPSKARIAGPISRADKQLLSRASKALFGKYRTARQLASMVGAPDNCRVVLSPDAEGTRIDYRVIGEQLDAFHGTFERHKDRVVHTIERLDVAAKYRGRPDERVGTRIHGRVVYWGDRLGVDGLQLTAARTEKDVGYLVWPNFGYDGPLRQLVRMAMPAELAHHETIQSLISTDQGRDYWQAHGQSIELSFGLARGSLNRKLWVKYWKTIPEEQRKPMEGESKDRAKRPVPPGELDPDGNYPNGLGMSNEQVVEGWRVLGESLRDPEVQELIRAKERTIREARLAEPSS